MMVAESQRLSLVVNVGGCPARDLVKKSFGRFPMVAFRCGCSGWATLLVFFYLTQGQPGSAGGMLILWVEHLSV